MLHRSEADFLWNRFHGRRFEAIEFCVVQFGMRLLQHTKNRFSDREKERRDHGFCALSSEDRKRNALIRARKKSSGCILAAVRVAEADIG